LAKKTIFIHQLAAVAVIYSYFSCSLWTDVLTVCRQGDTSNHCLLTICAGNLNRCLAYKCLHSDVTLVSNNNNNNYYYYYVTLVKI